MGTRNAKVFRARVSFQSVAEIKDKGNYQKSLKCYPGHGIL